MSIRLILSRRVYDADTNGAVAGIVVKAFLNQSTRAVGSATTDQVGSFTMTIQGREAPVGRWRSMRGMVRLCDSDGSMACRHIERDGGRAAYRRAEFTNVLGRRLSEKTLRARMAGVSRPVHSLRAHSWRTE